MAFSPSRGRMAIATLASCLGLLANIAAQASSTCPDEQATKQVPTDLALCEKLESDVRSPHSFPLNVYEEKLDRYLGAMCHRNLDGGWKVDKRVRDTGPWVGTYAGGKWTGQGFGTHAPVLIWYSPLMHEWLKANRPESGAPATAAPVPDGAMMIKEMYPYPAAACAGVDVLYLKANTQSSAVMVRD